MSIEIGKLIRAKLKSMGKTQGWLAEEMKSPKRPAGLSINAISKWMKTGKVARENVQQLADILDLSTDQLLAGDSRVELVPPGETTIDRLTPDEKQLLDLYRGSTNDGKSALMGMAIHTPKSPVRSLRRPHKP